MDYKPILSNYCFCPAIVYFLNTLSSGKIINYSWPRLLTDYVEFVSEFDFAPEEKLDFLYNRNTSPTLTL